MTLLDQLSDLEQVHARINLTNQRIAQIEHYLGMREHKFEEKNQMWDFNQVSTDVIAQKKPKSKFYKGSSRNQRHD